MQDVERAADRQAALHARLERYGLPRLQADRCCHVAHVVGVVRVALDSLEDPPPVPFWQGLDLCGIKFRAPHAIDAILSPYVAVSARWRGIGSMAWRLTRVYAIFPHRSPR